MAVKRPSSKRADARRERIRWVAGLPSGFKVCTWLARDGSYSFELEGRQAKAEGHSYADQDAATAAAQAVADAFGGAWPTPEELPAEPL